MSAKVVGVERVTKFFEELPQKAKEEAAKGMGRMVLKLQARVMRDKLSGQVLNVRTGTLRRSIDQAVYQDGIQIRGVVGTNVEYARVHEYGFSGAVTVKEHLRMIREQGRFSLKAVKGRDMGMWVKKRGKETGSEVLVKAHSRMVKLPPRSFLRSALKELEPEFLEEMDKAAGELAKD